MARKNTSNKAKEEKSSIELFLSTGIKPIYDNFNFNKYCSLLIELEYSKQLSNDKISEIFCDLVSYNYEEGINKINSYIK